MKITVDTKEDSYEDIYKILHILTGILEKKGQSHASGYSSSSPRHSSPSSQTLTDTASLMSMFDDSAQISDISAGKNENKDVAPDFSSFLNLTKPAEKKETMPKVEIF